MTPFFSNMRRASFFMAIVSGLHAQQLRARAESLRVLVVHVGAWMRRGMLRAPQVCASRRRARLRAIWAERLHTGRATCGIRERTAHENRTVRALGELRGHGSHDDSLHASVIMRSDHEEIRFDTFAGAQYLVGRVSTDEMHRDFAVKES